MLAAIYMTILLIELGLATMVLTRMGKDPAKKNPESMLEPVDSRPHCLHAPSSGNAPARPDKSICDFMLRCGWEVFDASDNQPVQRPSAKTARDMDIYEMYDLYWRKRFESEFAHMLDEKRYMMVKFDRDGDCRTLSGTPWEIVARQLDDILLLEAEGCHATRPPMPVIIKKRQRQS